MNIYLIGMMGSGKSTIGKSLAKALNFQFIDTDNEVEKQLGKPVQLIFEEEGEEVFREMEKDLVLSMSAKKNVVIATGGGLPCYFDNIEQMNQNGITIYLKASPAFLASRLKTKKQERPLIAGFGEQDMAEYLDDLLTKRRIFYDQAQYHVEAKSLKVKDLVDLINRT